jgi:hypothetical protein
MAVDCVLKNDVALATRALDESIPGQDDSLVENLQRAKQV